jgi:hypothetical protein
MATAITATANIRYITRDGMHIVQQMFVATFEAGTSKERVQRVWLDTHHPMFSAVESASEAQARLDIEKLFKEPDFRMIR